MENGLEADAVLVHRPQFDPTAGKCRCHLLQQWAQALFEVTLRRWFSRWQQIKKRRGSRMS
jgi:hypothetical protein